MRAFQRSTKELDKAGWQGEREHEAYGRMHMAQNLCWSDGLAFLGHAFRDKFGEEAHLTSWRRFLDREEKRREPSVSSDWNI